MKVLIITEEDVFYVRHFFKNFFPLNKNSNYEIAGVTILEPFNKESKTDLAKQMLSFYGLFHFLRVGTLYAIKTFLGITIEKISQSYGYEIIPVENVNDPAYIEEIKKRNIDVIVSIAAPQIFKKDLISSVNKGCINSHSSLLPENKGMMPVFWGLYKGDSEIGVTVHYMDEKLDNGDIILQKKVPVNNESLNEMILKTKKISATMIHNTLESMANGTINSTPMPEGGSCQTFPTAKEVREFKKRGKRIF